MGEGVIFFTIKRTKKRLFESGTYGWIKWVDWMTLEAERINKGRCQVVVKEDKLKCWMELEEKIVEEEE